MLNPRSMPRLRPDPEAWLCPGCCLESVASGLIAHSNYANLFSSVEVCCDGRICSIGPRCDGGKKKLPQASGMPASIKASAASMTWNQVIQAQVERHVRPGGRIFSGQPTRQLRPPPSSTSA